MLARRNKRVGARRDDTNSGNCQLTSRPRLSDWLSSSSSSCIFISKSLWCSSLESKGAEWRVLRDDRFAVAGTNIGNKCKNKQSQIAQFWPLPKLASTDLVCPQLAGLNMGTCDMQRDHDAPPLLEMLHKSYYFLALLSLSVSCDS